MIGTHAEFFRNGSVVDFVLENAGSLPSRIYLDFLLHFTAAKATQSGVNIDICC